MLITCLAALSFLSPSEAPPSLELRLPLRVLYASDAGTPYSAGWRDFSMRVTGLAESAPLSMRASANDEEIVIELDIRVGWHMYAKAQEKFAPVKLATVAGSRKIADEFDVPADENGWLTRKVALHVPLQRREVGKGLALELSFQLCDANSCRPIETVRLER